jgi:hypothetical protein
MSSNRKCLHTACVNVVAEGNVYCSPECEDSFREYVESMREQEASAQIKRDYELVIIEAQKIKLEKGDTLMVTVKNEYVEHDEIRLLSSVFKKAFPDNKVFVFNMGSDGDVKFAIASEPENTYCKDCNCGKKP